MSEWTVSSVIDALAGRGERPAILSVRAEAVDATGAARLADRAVRLATGLRARGLGKGDTVALLAPNGPDWVAAALGIMRSGAMLSAIDDQSSAEEIARVLEVARPKLLITTERHAATLAALGGAARPGATRLIGGGPSAPGWDDLFSDGGETLPVLAQRDPAALFFTSGTTGPPKAFVLNHGHIGENVEALLAERIVFADDRALLPLPMHHAYPVVVGLMVPLTLGTTVVLAEGLSGPRILRALHAGRVTVIVGVPRLYEALMAGIEARFARRGAWAVALFRRLARLCGRLRSAAGIDLGRALFAPVRRAIGPDLRLLVSGGAHLDAKLHARLEALGWLVLPGYGLAETASVFTCNRPAARRIGSAGRPLGDGRVRIAGPDEAGVGEIELAGSAVIAGYRDNPRADAEAFTADGWFRTGDLGRLDGDGFLWVVGRRKEVLVLPGGKKVDPETLERIYAASPLVEEIAVLEVDGKLVGLVRPALAEVRALGALDVAHAVKVGLAELMRDQPSWYRLAGVAIARSALPRTRLGKYRRFLLPELWRQAEAGAPARPPAPIADADRALIARPRPAAVWRILERRAAGRPLHPDDDLALDLAIDSLGWMALTLEVEEAAGLRLAPEAIDQAATVRDLLVAAEAAPAAPARRPSARPPTGAPATRGPALRLAGRLLHALDRALMRWWFGLRVEGLGHLPAAGGFVIAPNHASDLDPLAIAAALPPAMERRVCWAGDVVRLFSTAAGRAFARAVRLFPVDEHDPRAAIDVAVDIVKRGDVQVWFAEGWRSPDGSVQRFLPGIGMILDAAGAPVVPAWIGGTFQAMPRGRRWPKRHPITVRFGPAADAATLDAEAGPAPAEPRAARIARALRARVVALADAGHPDVIRQ